MATRRRSSRSAKKPRSALFSVFIGVLIGLAAAVGVTWYMHNSPSPFREGAKTPPFDLRPTTQAPTAQPSGPPASLAGTPLPAPAELYQDGARPATAASTSKPEAHSDELGSLIASLEPRPSPTAPAVSAKADPASTSGTVSSAKSSANTAASASTPNQAAKPAGQADNQGSYYLQAGAFRSADVAEATKVKILLLGMPAEVQVATLDGSAINRVRVGPFKGDQALKEAQTRLSQEQITTSVVNAKASR
ncbi:MAG TPA: SPOR domain-containing protein [Candidatus Paenalcaligenes intestinipullorum]|uniref:SPOR domain-containing protein n=1 Tax=Candidatus Paenalcaligenes intestinipullorum TaxID=2838718 RepID=A0A9D2RIQ0_9BURK|nr:SPOR domain-containing protein [Candidatus Paenalcaligenes intestinipullorum]